MSRPPRRIAVLDAPSNLGLRPPAPGRVPGVYKLAEALRAQNLLASLGAFDAGRVTPPPYTTERDPETRFRNGKAIAQYSLRLADRVYELLSEGAFPLVLGGDCSILLGDALALRRKGRYGLFFLDGHDDFSYPRGADAYTAAGLDLALVTGRGPDLLADIQNLKPYLRDEAVVAFGFDESDADGYDTRPLYESHLHLYPARRVREFGARRTAREALAELLREELEGFWIHLDADILNSEVMPAVDCPNPSGISYEELYEVLEVLLSSEKAVGMEITIFDPELDSDASIAKAFTACIARAFAGGK